MLYLNCSVPERFVNPLFEVFDGGDFILSSYRDIEEDHAEMRIFLEDPASASEAERRLRDALAVVGLDSAIERREIPDEDWKLAYRRHFKTEAIGRRLMTVPVWEFEKLSNPEGREVIVLDPGMAFGTGKHETTRACLEFVEECSPAAGERGGTFLDMGCGSGILSIAAAKLGFESVTGFDVDPEAVRASRENAAANGVEVRFEEFALGRRGASAATRFVPADTVVANILGPLLIRFADEIVPCFRHNLILSGILTDLYPEVRAAYESRGLVEKASRTIGEWTTGLFARG